MLVSIQRHDSLLLSEFNNAARKTDKSNEEEREGDDSYREEEEPPVRYWQEEIIEEIRRHQCIWNTKSVSFKDQGFSVYIGLCDVWCNQIQKLFVL